jgi:site-specific DNA recombinase
MPNTKPPHRTTTRNASDHLLTGLLYDDVGNRMVPTHATKASIRYRYYISSPHFDGNSRTAAVGSVSRVAATDIEGIILKSLNEHLSSRSGLIGRGDHRALLEHVVSIEVHQDRLCLQLKSPDNSASDESSGEQTLSIPWQKPPSRRSRQILLPHGASRTDIRPERAERRVHLVSTIARGRRWLNEVVSSAVTEAEQIADREKCSVRQVNMTISLAFLAPALVKAAIEGRLPRGIGIERLRDPPPEWAHQFEALGLNPN